MGAIFYALFLLAASGFTVTLICHVASLFGIPLGLQQYLKFLFPGVFVVFLPTIFVMNRLTRDFKQKDLWRAALRGCPPWMRRAVGIIAGYSWLGFFGLPWLYGGGMNSPANRDRVMSAMLMTFYLVPAAVLYSATRVQSLDESRRCLNGHRVSPSAKFCEQCGAPVAAATKESHSYLS